MRCLAKARLHWADVEATEIKDKSMATWSNIYRNKTIKTCVRTLYKTSRFLASLQKDVTQMDPDVVFFGDSVARHRNDGAGDTLLTHIFQGCSGTVVSFDRAASTPALNRIIISHLPECSAKKRIAVVFINVRSFADTWPDLLKFQLPHTRIVCDWRSGRETFGTSLLNSVKTGRKHDWKDIGEVAVDGNEIANFSYPSESIHQKVGIHKIALQELSQKGFITIPVIIPCPINNLSKEHREQYRRNVDLICKYLREISPNVLDLSEIIKSNGHFTDSEHLAEPGRVVVGKKIQEIVRKLLPEIWQGKQSVVHCVNTDCLFGVKVRESLPDEVLSKISRASNFTLAPLHLYGFLMSWLRDDYYAKNLARTLESMLGTQEGTDRGLGLLQDNRRKLNTGLKNSWASLLEKNGESKKALALYKSVASSRFVAKAAKKTQCWEF